MKRERQRKAGLEIGSGTNFPDLSSAFSPFFWVGRGLGGGHKISPEENTFEILIINMNFWAFSFYFYFLL
jgi:hypothetical protein